METPFAPAEPTLHMSSNELEAGRFALEKDVAIHTCPSCEHELEDRYHFDCPECGENCMPVSRCRSCGGAVIHELVRYSARVGDASACKLLAGVSCPVCGVAGVEERELDALEDLAAHAPGLLEVLPESGLFTPDVLEVLADAAVCGSGEPEQIEKQRDGVRVRIGAPSELFELALPLITAHDPKDIFSPTLVVEPGPPYSPARRRTILRLLAEIQCELGAPVCCWSASVGLSEEPLVDPILSEQLGAWEADTEGLALALYHAITAGHAPGPFRNGVRLLERVLGLPAGAPIAEALRERARARQPPPFGVLQQLWLSMHPGRPFDEARVYDSMQAFHALEREPFDASGRARMPWEQPDFEGYAAWLRRLVSELLAG